MNNFSVMGLDTEHCEELCEDILQQYRDGVSTLALFSMALVPEGNPPIDKAGQLCEKYDLFRDRLRSRGADCGILAQATIGHGSSLNNPIPFQRYVGLADGKETNVCCPYDVGFRLHMYGQMRTLALHQPAQIMVDDDLRLIRRPGRGCACPLHMAAFNQKAGTDLNREELYAQIRSDTEQGRLYEEIFIETQKESLLGAARAMRDGIDSVDPSIPGAFCCCGDGAEFGAEMGQVLAGAGNPVVVRINNGNYTAKGAREFSSSMFRAACQIAVLGDSVDVILAETDTCPHNRYSTSASQLHSHFTGSILEGVGGAKHWITSMRAYEPGSGEAYRRILREHAGFYAALAELVPSLQWEGCCLPVSSRPDYGIKKENLWGLDNDGWSRCVLERLGLPMFYGKGLSGAVFLDGSGDARFTDPELLEFFRGPVFLASDTARRLIDRGFQHLIGVDVVPWAGAHISGEQLAGGVPCRTQKSPQQLIPLSDSVVSDSVVYHLQDGQTLQPLFPGTTVFRNALGGTTVVFCGTPKAAFTYTEGFAFLNESRKKQLIRLLSDCGQLPVYYPGDAEVYFRTARTADGEQFCAFFNIGLDPIPQITLVCQQEVHSVRMLTAQGSRKACSFRCEDAGTLVIDEPAGILDPVILFLG